MCVVDLERQSAAAAQVVPHTACPSTALSQLAACCHSTHPAHSSQRSRVTDAAGNGCRAADSRLRTQNSGLRDSELRLKTQSHTPRTFMANSGLLWMSSGLCGRAGAGMLLNGSNASGVRLSSCGVTDLYHELRVRYTAAGMSTVASGSLGGWAYSASLDTTYSAASAMRGASLPLGQDELPPMKMPSPLKDTCCGQAHQEDSKQAVSEPRAGRVGFLQT